jgi:hypothetical protein
MGVGISQPSATVMVVSWIPLSYSEARGFVSHYTVVYSSLTRTLQALDTVNRFVPGMDSNTTRIEGLDANTHYIVQVSATNGAGRSDISPPVGIVAPEGTMMMCIQYLLCLHACPIRSLS